MTWCVRCLDNKAGVYVDAGSRDPSYSHTQRIISLFEIVKCNTTHSFREMFHFQLHSGLDIGLSQIKRQVPSFAVAQSLVSFSSLSAPVTIIRITNIISICLLCMCATLIRVL